MRLFLWLLVICLVGIHAHRNKKNKCFECNEKYESCQRELNAYKYGSGHGHHSHHHHGHHGGDPNHNHESHDHHRCKNTTFTGSSLGSIHNFIPNDDYYCKAPASNGQMKFEVGKTFKLTAQMSSNKAHSSYNINFMERNGGVGFSLFGNLWNLNATTQLKPHTYFNQNWKVAGNNYIHSITTNPKTVSFEVKIGKTNYEVCAHGELMFVAHPFPIDKLTGFTICYRKTMTFFMEEVSLC